MHKNTSKNDGMYFKNYYYILHYVIQDIQSIWLAFCMSQNEQTSTNIYGNRADIKLFHQNHTLPLYLSKA